MRTIKDKVVVITGAGSGFGRALALEIAGLGGVPILLDVNDSALRESSHLVAATGARSGSFIMDVRDAAQWADVAQRVVAEFGRVDVLINNAGVLSRAESFLEGGEEHGRFIFDVNFWGMFHGCKTLVPILARRPDAALVNIASSLALIGSPMHAVYCASKAAINSYTAVVRQELAGTRVRVMIVFPGPSKTGLGRNVPTADAEKRERDARNFDRFAITPAEVVARRIVKGIIKRRQTLVTSSDARLMQVFQRIAPGVGHSLMATVYRKVSDPKLFERLKGLG